MNRREFVKAAPAVLGALCALGEVAEGGRPITLILDRVYEQSDKRNSMICPDCGLAYREHGKAEDINGESIVLCPGDYTTTDFEGNCCPLKIELIS